MMRSFLYAAARAWLAAIAIASSALAATPPVLTVESVLPPAWVERTNGRREPLAIGMPLANGEKVHTGDGGKAMLRLADGSAVKLGESGLVAVSDLFEKKDAKGGLVNASLDVVRGAFRFTTGVLSPPPNPQRNVNVRVNAVTAGIRGTDVWGKSEDDQDIVCLLEGRVTVSHGNAQFTMQEPHAFYIAPRKGKAAPPGVVSAAQIREWSAETEIDPRTGAMRRGGTASVIVASATDERGANAQRDKLRDSGFPAEVARAADGRFEVRIGSLADSVEAGLLADRLRKLGFPQAK